MGKVRNLFQSVMKGLRWRLLWVGLLFLGAALLTNTLAGFFYTRAIIRRSAGEVQSEVARRVAGEIEEFIRRKQERLLDLAASLNLYESGSREQRLLALLLLSNDASISDLAILNRKGAEVLKVSERRTYLPSELSDQRESESFKSAVRGENYISDVYSSDRAEPYVTLTVPMRLGPKEIVGVVSAGLNLKFLWQVVGDIRFGTAGYAYLVDRQGHLIAHRDRSEVLRGRSLTGLPSVKRFFRNEISIDPALGEEGQGFYGEPVLASYAPVPLTGWAVVLEEPVRIALAEQTRLMRYSLLLLVVGLLLGALVIVWVSGRITRPIRELHHGAELIAGGNLDHQVHIKTGDEIEQLAEEFNRMAERLRISHATLEQRVEQRTHELSALYSITQTVNQSLDLDIILKEAIGKVLDVIGFDAGVIFLLDREAEQLRMRTTRGFPGPMESKPHRIGEGIVGKVVEKGEELTFEDMQTDPDFARLARGRRALDTGFRANASFPIKIKDRILGVVALMSRQSHRFTSEELDLIRSMAGQIGVAIENATLFAEVKKKSEELEALVNVSRDIAALLDRQVLLSRIAEVARNLLNMDGVSFRLLEGDSTLRVAAAGMRSVSFLPSAGRGESLSDRVFASDGPVMIQRIGEDSTIGKETRDTLLEVGFNSFLGIPLRVGKRMIGTINLYSGEERHFLPEEIGLAIAFADQTAIAIQNANLFAEVSEKTMELEKLNRDLEEANRVKSEFMSAVSHELRTPLGVIIGNGELLRGGFYGAVSEEQGEAVDKILRYSQMLLKLINDLLMLHRTEARGMTLDISTLDLETIIASLSSYVDELVRRNRDVEVMWEVDRGLPLVTTDGFKLEEILQNLLGNAFKFTRKGHVKIQVRDLSSEARIEFAVSDTGIGVRKEDLERIFEAFHQVKREGYDGVGLGLNIVKRYLELMQGEIHVESEPEVGSRFAFTIPYKI